MTHHASLAFVGVRRIVKWLIESNRVRVGDFVISAGRILGGTSGYVIRKRRVIVSFALVEVDTGRFLRGKRLWLRSYTLVAVDPPRP